MSEDPLSVPYGPGSFRLPYEHVESVARVCSPLRSVLQKQRFGRVVDQVEKIVGGRDESVRNAGRLFDIRMHPDWGGIDNEPMRTDYFIRYFVVRIISRCRIPRY